MPLPNAPRTWINEQPVTAEAFNEDIYQNLRFLLNPPRVSVYSTVATTAQSANTFPPDSTGGFNIMSWNSAKFDSDNMFRGSGPRVYITTPGIYEVVLHVEWEYKLESDGNGGNRYAVVKKNDPFNSGKIGEQYEIGADHIYCRAGLPEHHVNHLSFHHQFAAEDYVTVAIRNTIPVQASTHPAGLTNPHLFTYLSLLWVAKAP